MTERPTIRLAWSEQASPLLVPTLIFLLLLLGLLFSLGMIASLALHTSTLAVASFGPLLVVGTLLFFRAGRRRGGSLELHPGGLLRLRRGFRRTWLRRDEVTGVLGAGPRTLRLDTRGGAQFRFGLDSEVGADGIPVLDRLRAHLGLGSGRRALSVALRPLLGAFTSGLLAFLVLDVVVVLCSVFFLRGHGHAYIAALFFVAPFVVAPYCGRKLAFSRLTVGEDGVLVERFVFRRLLRYRELARAELAPGYGIRLTEVNGAEHVHFAFGQANTELTEIVNQIRSQIARYAENVEPTGDALARGDRSVAEWRRAVGQLARGGGSFRQTTLAPEVLHRIVVDAAAPLDRRVGAALALREVDPAAGARVRLAAEGSAELRVRLALEAAAGNDDEPLDEAALDRATRARSARLSSE